MENSEILLFILHGIHGVPMVLYNKRVCEIGPIIIWSKRDFAGISVIWIQSKISVPLFEPKFNQFSPISLFDTSMLQSDKSEFNTRYQSPEYELLQVFFYYHHYCYYNYYVFIVFKNGALKEYGTWTKAVTDFRLVRQCGFFWCTPTIFGFVYLKNMRHFNYFISYATI